LDSVFGHINTNSLYNWYINAFDWQNTKQIMFKKKKKKPYLK
jgi:hypothetical protein